MLELLITLFIMGIMASALMAMLGSFSSRQQLDTSAFTLLNDLRQTQTYATSRKDGFGYYGIRFYNGLGQNSDRQGWKILRYCDATCTGDPTSFPITDSTNNVTIKSSVSADNPEFLEDTFFNRRVDFAADSELVVGEKVIFNPDGSATSNGTAILDNNNDTINLTLDQTKRTITIVPLTGYVRIQ